ncbi:DUF4007 family protein [Streptomyces phytophilus]|uniref:DUF4007 family protein n=1 Tax=Streptomyces phytophilus TaxID=722715 RepID=UPI0015F04CA9|nr:DUF4007 family protein [Streptomyces phytophilus]
MFGNCVPDFGRHGSYPPRLGWLPKVHVAVGADPLVFSRPQAPVVLGVGSSMVRAMRFWSRAFGLIRIGDRRSGGHPAVATRRAAWLLDEDRGADPYLEDPGTLWLLHWWLLSARPCHVPTFRLLFGQWWRWHFLRSELRYAVRTAAVAAGWREPADSLINRDITALIAMYAEPRYRPGTRIPEEGLENFLTSPFRQLGLVDAAPEHRDGTEDPASRGGELLIHRHRGNVAPRAILASASLEYAHTWGTTGPGSIALTRLHTDPLGPGRLMLTDHRALHAALSWAANGPLANYVTLSESSLDGELLSFAAPPRALADRLLAAYYNLSDGPGAPR